MHGLTHHRVDLKQTSRKGTVMSKYLEKQREWFEFISKEIDATENPRHKAILQNFKNHASYELSGNWEKIFTPEMTVDEPRYEILGLGLPEFTIFDGDGAVQGFYGRLNSGVVMFYDEENLAVADWGFASFPTAAVVFDGADLVAAGVEVDSSARYIAEYPCAMRWLYDADAKMIGEHVYQIGETRYTKLDAANDVTMETRNALVRQYMPN